MINLKTSDLYSIEELVEIIIEGKISFQRFFDSELSSEEVKDLRCIVNDLANVGESDTIKEFIGKLHQDINKEELIEQEEHDWLEAELIRNGRSYQNYIQKWSIPYKLIYAKHIEDAYIRLNNINPSLDIRRQKWTEKLLTDMKENPWRYNQELLRLLFKYKLTEFMKSFLAKHDKNELYTDFLLAGYKLKIEDLIERGVLPKELTRDDILAPDYRVDANQCENIEQAQEKETDVYFIGCPRSGKTSILASILYKLDKDQRVSFSPQIVDGIDKNAAFCNSLIYALSSKKTPEVQRKGFFSSAKITIRSNEGERQNHITFVDLYGDIIKEMGDRFITPSIMLRDNDTFRILNNDNRKVIFFLLDYSVISNKSLDTSYSGLKQIMELETFLQILTLNGPDSSNPKKGCIMSKVDTVAVIMTKCDLMNVSSHQKRLDLTMKEISETCRNFMQNLFYCCQEFHINRANDYRPYIIAYSLGKFFVGNTVIIDESYPGNFIDFLTIVTSQSKRKWPFR